MALVHTTPSDQHQSFDPNGPGLQFQVFTQNQLRLLGDRQGAEGQAGGQQVAATLKKNSGKNREHMEVS